MTRASQSQGPPQRIAMGHSIISVTTDNERKLKAPPEASSICFLVILFNHHHHQWIGLGDKS
jgi:hypothetical protein